MKASFNWNCEKCGIKVNPSEEHICGIKLPKPTKQENRDYERECKHKETCYWKECPECREFLVRKEFQQKSLAIEEEIKEVLLGIDIDECADDNGWWETSGGALFGLKKKQEVLAIIKKHLR